jgi:micrococcal nuclease
MSAIHDSALFTSDSSSGQQWVAPARVLRVIDADTLVMERDCGCRIKMHLTVRLLGINAPEMRTPEGADARQFVMDWLAQHGMSVTLQTFKDENDSFGRYLACVSVGQHCLNEELLKAGHAKEYRK